MLRKSFRLKSPVLFRQAMNGRRICHNDCFVVYGLPHRPGQAGVMPRFGLIVSKKVDKRATRRNRVKRQIREIIRMSLLSQPSERLRQYRAVVIIARSGCLKSSFAHMKAKLTGCFASPNRMVKPS